LYGGDGDLGVACAECGDEEGRDPFGEEGCGSSECLLAPGGKRTFTMTMVGKGRRD